MSVSNYFDEVRLKELYMLLNSTLCNHHYTTATLSIFCHIFLVAMETVSSEYRNYFKMKSGEVYCMSRINLGSVNIECCCVCVKHQLCNDSIDSHTVVFWIRGATNNGNKSIQWWVWCVGTDISVSYNGY